MVKQLFILVGPPGSGKSSLSKEIFDHCVYINQDSQGKEHLDLFHKAIAEGANIVVDRMNFNKQQRNRYLEPAKASGYKTEIIVIHQPRKVCFERMMKRENHETIKNAESANLGLNLFFSKYEKPTPDEANYVNFIYPLDVVEPAVIVDLDGTLCNIEHRLHHVQKPEGQKKNWKAFFQDLDKDQPNQWCADLVTQMAKKHTVVFASGRPDDYRAETEQWLERHGFSTNHLYMRCTGDHRQDYIAKETILDFEILTRFKPLFFVDDRQQVSDLWRRRGFVCLQCSPGDF